jgi:enolase-phosphatase E1
VLGPLVHSPLKPGPQDTSGVRAFLLDIEGTTTPVSFVYDVLFPYARRELPGFLADHERDEEVAGALAALRDEHRADAGAPAWEEGGLDGALGYLRWLMDADRKSTALKALQGLVWRDGYGKGQLQGIVYPDVPPALARWRAQGRRTFIYSSGSVLAQRLLFSTTPDGDLTAFIDGYFDTTTGPKKEPDSYRRIAAAIGLDRSALFFVSDSVDEVRAALAAGLRAALCAREGLASGAPGPLILTFDVL